MNVVLLAGGYGTRLAEETSIKPKPMVEIGGMPVLMHIMHIYGGYGYKDFIVACGYKGEIIKEYFHKFFYYNSDFVVNLGDGSHEVTKASSPKWRVQLVDTGLDTMTGGRILRLKNLIGNKRFMATYGDGVGNINIPALLDFHRSHHKIATVTAVRPPARFGGLVFNGNQIIKFTEKPQTGEGWINGGFFVFEPEVFDYIDGDQTSLEREPLERLASDGQLMAYFHENFWQPMDTLRDKKLLESMWVSDRAPWKVW
jgi:glucose-1-phosphate cytidylyltransferase